MLIRLLSYIAIGIFTISLNNISAQISIQSVSDDTLSIISASDNNSSAYKSKLAQHAKLHIPESNIHQFHDVKRQNLQTKFYHNDDLLWELNLNRLEELSHVMDIELLIDQHNPITQQGLKISSYSGSLSNNKKTSVFLTVVENKVRLIIDDNIKQHTVSWSNDKNSYIYEESDLSSEAKNLMCNTPNHTYNKIQLNKDDQLKSNNTTCQVINLQFYTDFLFYETHNKNVEEGLSKIMSTVAQIQEDYDQYNIKFNVNFIQFSTCQACDQWTDNLDISKLLHDFKLKTEPIQDNSIKLFLTGRVFNSFHVGMATFNTFCTSNAKAVIQNLESPSWHQRVVVSHEIGHILGANHDNSGPNIMSSNVNNTSTWSNQSSTTILNKIANSACLNDCSSKVCTEISDIKVLNKESSNMTIEWTSNTSNPVHYELINLESNEIIDSGNTTSQLRATNLLGCEEYELKLYAECTDGSTHSYSKIISTSSQEYIFINNVNIVNCNSSEFDLQLYLSHNLSKQQKISITIGQKVRQFVVKPATTIVRFRSLSNHGQMNELITLSLVTGTSELCSSRIIFDMPKNDCSIKWVEDFNTNKLPDFWTIENSNNTSFTSPFSWKFAGSDREIGNYNYGSNVPNGATINGTNMAYMDDDYLAFDSYTGTTTMFSPKINLSQFSKIDISFDYLFDRFTEKGDNQSQFNIYAWSGNAWINIFTAEQTSCPWHKIWDKNCPMNATIDLSLYNHSAFQLKFVYTDGGNQKWTGMAAFDNFTLEARKAVYACMDQKATNYTNQADIHNQKLCTYICPKEVVVIDTYPKSLHVSEADKIEASGSIRNYSNVSFAAQSSISLMSGFYIEAGSTVSIYTEQCPN